MKHIVTLAALLFTLSCFSQPTNTITIGKIDTVRSKILNETRQVMIYVPPSAGNKMYSKTVYPVLYLLDGPAHFHSVTGMIQQLSVVSGNTVLPEMIVVGIVNTDRTRDLTPTHSTSSPYNQSPESLKTSGGGDNFLAFLEKELIPYIDSTYPVAPYRMLVGHSFGGLMVMHTLLTKPGLFNSYVAIDPSLWWDNGSTNKNAIQAVQQGTFPAKPFYMAIANTLNTNRPLPQVEKDTAATSTGMKSEIRFVNTMDRYKKAYPSWHWKYYPDDTHGSVPMVAAYDAFRTIFKEHNLKYPADPADMEVGLFVKQYQKISKLLGYKVAPPEARINRMGYTLMELKKQDKAYEFFKLNIDNYPGSFMAHDSMGDYYLATGEKEKAIEQFKKALSLREFPQTRQKLEKVSGER